MHVKAAICCACAHAAGRAAVSSMVPPQPHPKPPPNCPLCFLTAWGAASTQTRCAHLHGGATGSQLAASCRPQERREAGGAVHAQAGWHSGQQGTALAAACEAPSQAQGLGSCVVGKSKQHSPPHHQLPLTRAVVTKGTRALLRAGTARQAQRRHQPQRRHRAPVQPPSTSSRLHAGSPCLPRPLPASACTLGRGTLTAQRSADTALHQLPTCCCPPPAASALSGAPQSAATAGTQEADRPLLLGRPSAAACCLLAAGAPLPLAFFMDGQAMPVYVKCRGSLRRAFSCGCAKGHSVQSCT